MFTITLEIFFSKGSYWTNHFKMLQIHIYIYIYIYDENVQHFDIGYNY